MGQATPFRKLENLQTVESGSTRSPVMAWALIAGLVDVRPNGSWDLSELGKEQLREQVLGSLRGRRNERELH
jgi:hypothetical protein